MPGIADIIMQQMATAGQPRIAKETSTVTAPGEGLDIGSIIMMLMMSQLFKGKGPATGPGLPIAPPMGGPALDTGLLGMGGGGPIPGGGGLPGPMAGPGPDFGLMGGGAPSPNVGMPTPPTDISAGIPLQAPQNLQDLMMIVDLLSKMDTNPYA